MHPSHRTAKALTALSLTAALGCQGTLVSTDEGRELQTIGRPTGCLPTAPTPPVFPAAVAADPSSELVSGGATSFASIANVPAVGGRCSTSNYDVVDFCFNEENPPAPSISRRIGLEQHGTTTDSFAPYEQGGMAEHRGDNRIPAQAGNFQELPFTRTSNDGRIVLSSIGTWPTFTTLRPEAVGPDHTIANADQPPLPSRSFEMHPLAWFNPVRTGFSVNTVDGLGVNAEISGLLNGVEHGHATLCDASTDRETAGASRRNPVPCTAFYGDYPYGDEPSDSNDLREGVCYRLTYLVGANVAARWELRSAPVTFFVENPYHARTGGADDSRVWVYPDNPEHAFDAPAPDGTVHLPAFGPYDLGRMFPWNRIGGTDSAGDPTDGPNHRDILGFVTRPTMPMGPANAPIAVDTDCYIDANLPPAGRPSPEGDRGRRGPGTPTPPPNWVENPDAPAWCQFVFAQRYSQRMTFDEDGDSTVDRQSTGGTGMTVFNGTGRELFELATTGDGRVLVVNARTAFYAVNERGPCDAAGFSSFLPLSSMPIDPMMLPSATRRGYGVAMSAHGQPFQDPSGRPIPFGSLSRFAYQWIDREGNNLFIATVNESRDSYHVAPEDVRRVPVRSTDLVGATNIVPLLQDGQTAERERYAHTLNSRAGHQFAVVGAWTAGRYIALDNGLNASDFGGGGWFGATNCTDDPSTPAAFGCACPNGSCNSTPIEYEFALDLYSDHTLEFIPRSNSMTGSFENRFNMFESLAPTLPVDVTWEMFSNNGTTSEVSFDEYLDRRAFAVVHGNASLRFYHEPTYQGTRESNTIGGSLVAVEDGFSATGNWWSYDAHYEFNTQASRNGQPGARPILQNAAPYSTAGEVRLHGGARIEPVALGGVLGRGVFLDGANDYFDVRYPRDLSQNDWFYGLWIEPHAMPSGAPSGDSAVRELVRFSDGSFFGLKMGADGARDFIAVGAHRNTERLLELGDLIPSQRFTHIGVRSARVGSAGRRLDLFINGTKVGSLDFAAFGEDAGFNVMGNACDAGTCSVESWVSVGAPNFGQTSTGLATRSFRGWVDELRIYRMRSEDLDDASAFMEQACNMALGTLVDSDERVPVEISQRVAHFGAATGHTPRYVCEQLVIESTNEPRDIARQHRRTLCADRVHRGRMAPACVRNQFLQAPALHASQPRVSTETNNFCLSCHTDASPIIGLRIGALAGPTQAQLDDPMSVLPPLSPRYRDPRRQPLNPPATLALPHYACPGWSLDNTFYAWFPRSSSLQRSDGTWTEDHVFDDGVDGDPARLMPPGPF